MSKPYSPSSDPKVIGYDELPNPVKTDKYGRQSPAIPSCGNTSSDAEYQEQTPSIPTGLNEPGSWNATDGFTSDKK